MPLSFCPWRDSRSRSPRDARPCAPPLPPPSRLRCYHPCESRNSLFGKNPPCLDHSRRFLFPGDSHLELPDLLRPFSSSSLFSITVSQFLNSWGHERELEHMVALMHTLDLDFLCGLRAPQFSLFHFVPTRQRHTIFSYGVVFDFDPIKNNHGSSFMAMTTCPLLLFVARIQTPLPLC